MQAVAASVNQDLPLNPNIHYAYSKDLKQKRFFAKTAMNFYNLAKGYWRPKNKKSKRVKIEGQIQKQINVLQAYGEYNSFKRYQ